VVYDFGLTEHEVARVQGVLQHLPRGVLSEKRMRPFVFSRYPPHVGYHGNRATYAYRAAVLHDLQEQFRPSTRESNWYDEQVQLLWIDPSVHINKRLAALQELLRSKGFIATVPVCKSGCIATVTAETTSRSSCKVKDGAHDVMSSYFGFGEDGILDRAVVMERDLLGTAVIGFDLNNKEISKRLLGPWIECCFDADCMAPLVSTHDKPRHDEAALSLAAFAYGVNEVPVSSHDLGIVCADASHAVKTAESLPSLEEELAGEAAGSTPSIHSAVGVPMSPPTPRIGHRLSGKAKHKRVHTLTDANPVEAQLQEQADHEFKQQLLGDASPPLNHSARLYNDWEEERQGTDTLVTLYCGSGDMAEMNGRMGLVRLPADKGYALPEVVSVRLLPSGFVKGSNLPSSMQKVQWPSWSLFPRIDAMDNRKTSHIPCKNISDLEQRQREGASRGQTTTPIAGTTDTTPAGTSTIQKQTSSATVRVKLKDSYEHGQGANLPHVLHPEPPSATIAEDCANDPQFGTSCDGWAKAGECVRNPYMMRVGCKMSCQVCMADLTKMSAFERREYESVQFMRSQAEQAAIALMSQGP